RPAVDEAARGDGALRARGAERRRDRRALADQAQCRVGAAARRPQELHDRPAPRDGAHPPPESRGGRIMSTLQDSMQPRRLKELREFARIFADAIADDVADEILVRAEQRTHAALAMLAREAEAPLLVRHRWKLAMLILGTAGAAAAFEVGHQIVVHL